MRNFKEEWVTSDHLQCEIRRIEGFDVTIFDKHGTEINGDQLPFREQHYHLWSKAASRKMTIGSWMEMRFARWMPDNRVTIWDLGGGRFDDSTMLADVRAEYGKHMLRPIWPDTRSLHFLFDVPDAAASYRLKEELYALGYEVRRKEQGLIWKDYLVAGRIQKVRCLDFELVGWINAFKALSTKYSAEFSWSFGYDYEFDTYGE